jgi:NAD(P) transhydrogenase subunit alpha
MTSELEVGLYIFMLAGFLGYHIITKVPPLLHTPLMSATNAIAAISLVGSLVVAGSDYSNVPNGWVCTLLGFLAVTCSATNAVGGFLITDRLPPHVQDARGARAANGGRSSCATGSRSSAACSSFGSPSAAARELTRRTCTRAPTSAALLLHRLGARCSCWPEGPELTPSSRAGGCCLRRWAWCSPCSAPFSTITYVTYRLDRRSLSQSVPWSAGTSGRTLFQ